MPQAEEMNLSGFPHCQGGDVLIVLAPDKTFTLHAVMLRRHSSYFARELTLENATHLKRGLGLTIRYRFDLIDRPGPSEKGPGRFNRTEIDEQSQPLTRDLARPDPSAGRIPNPIYNHYTSFFTALYGSPINLSTSIRDLVLEVDGLIDIAEYLGSVHVISPTIEAALLRQGQTLFRSIARAPVPWCDVAVRGRMALVAEEAVRHLVGQWNGVDGEARRAVPECVRPLLERKVRECEGLKKGVEIAVLKYHAKRLEKDGGIMSDKANKMAYANDVYLWIALAIFRSWFSTELCEGRGRNAADGGFGLYTLVHEGRYLEKEDLTQWSKTGFSISVRGLGVLAREVGDIKKDVALLVKPLLENKSNLDTGKFPLQYLTCVGVGKAEILRMLPNGPRVEAAEPMYVGYEDEEEAMESEDTPGPFYADEDEEEIDDD